MPLPGADAGTLSYVDALDVLDAMMLPPYPSSPSSSLGSGSSPPSLSTSRSRWNGMRAVTVSGATVHAFLLQHGFARDDAHATAIGKMLVRIGGLVPTFRVAHLSDVSFSAKSTLLYVHRGLTNARDSRCTALNAVLTYPLHYLSSSGKSTTGVEDGSVVDHDDDREGRSSSSSSSTPPSTARPRPLVSVLRDLSEAFAALCHVAVTLDGQFVAYDKLRGSAGWRRMLLLLCELAHARDDNDYNDEISSRWQYVSDNEKKAHWFNLYNLMIFHAKLVYGHPMDLVRRGKFFNDAAYIVAGRRLSSLELEHNVLRGRRLSKAEDDQRVDRWRLHGIPDETESTEGETTRRRKRRTTKTVSTNTPTGIVTILDPRMHFVLNCGAHSCPPLRPVSATQTEAHLSDVTARFIDAMVRVDDDARRVTASRLFKWFRKDFISDHEVAAAPSSPTTKDKEEQDLVVLQWMRDHASKEMTNRIGTAVDLGYKLKFDVYNWADNGDAQAKPDIRFMAIYDLSFARSP